MIRVVLTAILLNAGSAIAQPSAINDVGPARHVSPGNLAAEVKTYKVTLSKSDKGHNRTIYIQAKDSSDARQTAKDQNPGWQVENVSEVK